MNVEVISKATGTVTQVATDAIDLNAPSIVRLDITRAQVAGFERQGEDLVIRLVDGETIRVVDFYPPNATIPNDLVLRETDGSQWLARPGAGAPRFKPIDDFDDLLAAHASAGGSSLTIPALLGGLAAAAGIAAVAGGSGGNDARPSGGQEPDPGTGAPAPDRDPPGAPTGTVRGDGAAIVGRGEAGATVSVRDAAGAVIGTAVVAADGSYTATVSPPQVNGQRLTVTQADAAGNVSPVTAIQAPDTTAPAAPVATIDATGTTITGRGEAGATVTIRDASGAVVGTATVGADGTYAVTLSTPQANGGTLSITQTDAAGNISPAASTTAPDLTAPAAPVATISSDGTTVTGTGEPGGRVTVTNAAGAPLGTAVVAADGSYTIALAPAQANGGTLSVIQSDPAGNASPATNVAAPDITAPVAPVATVNGDGTVVTGTGEPGSRVTVTDSGGTPVGSATVAADGSYSVTLSPPQADGQALTVTQADAAGNVSPPTGVAAPDITGPAAPTITIDATGTQVSGSGQPGARVTITDPAGTTIGTALVAADGSYTAVLTTPQVNGERVDARQADAAGNPSDIASTVAPDLTAPAQPTATINADGSIVSGAGEPGARITVTDAAGAVLGSATVAADGSYSVALAPAQADGEALGVTQVDAAGNAAPPLPLTAPDITAPPAPVATLDPTGTVISGTGEPGARISVRDPNGVEIGSATVGAQGSYAVVLATPQVDSQTLTVSQSDAAGNASPATPLTAPDLTAPAAPTATVGADGTTVTGTGEPGASISVRSPLGAVIATATVAADGSYTATLTPAQTDGEALVVRQADAAGNVSPPATAIAPDLVVDSDPAAPTAAVTADGTAVVGVAIGGATITLYDANGAVIGAGVANADGSYSVGLSPPRVDGETVRVTQTEADGDVSPPATAVAPDLTAPAAPAATLDGTGNVVTGTGEAGAVVTVRAPDGTVLGTATVAANGAYAVILATPQANGGTLSVSQADAAGNVSPATALAVPDLIAPAAPAATVSADGTAVSGSGEPGTIATVRDAAGTVIGSATVAADGSYTVPLATVQANGETVSVTLADAAGNVSPSTSAVAPDITAPAAPVATIAADGATVAGTGEPGATVTVTAPGGAVIGTTVIGPSGSYAVAISPAQANGETLSVSQSDAAGNASPATTVTAPDFTAPAAPTAAISSDGATVTGIGEAGATVTIRNSGGVAVGTALVAADGSYTATLTPAQANGGTLSASQSDAAGNVSPAIALAAPDITAPAAPTLVVDTDGSAVTGTGEPGATVTITSPAGATIGTAIVAADGSYAAAISPAQVNGELVGATQADAAGNVSGSASALAPDFTAPVSPVATINADGTIVSGTGEPGATVTITGPAGIAVGTATVALDGSYSVTLAPPQANGEALTVTQSDAAGNASPGVAVTAPDITAPAAPTATISSDGATVTGTGEAGATVTIASPAGTTIGTAVVAADGSYSATLAPAQANGGTLSVTQADSAGNSSLPTSVAAPDSTAPAAPTISISSDGASVTGTGEAGATVTITNPGGAAIGTAVVGADGNYSATLTTPQTNGERVDATQADAAGNVSGTASTIAPDLTAPVAPTGTINTDGTAITGRGEAGATITVRGAGGDVGTATVGSDGNYTATLAPAQANGEALTVVQTDAAGNVSAALPLVAPDITAPPAPPATLDATGTIVSGTGEAGATVTVRDTGGAALGSALVGAQGAYSVTLSAPQVNSQTLAVVQTDAAGNTSPATPLTARDFTAPLAPTATVAADGLTLSGSGEAGATVTVRSPLGATIGTAVVAPDGTYTVTLAAPQVDGETLTVTQADAAGNVSPSVTATAPDLVPDTDPVAPTATVGADGGTVAGLATGGATITVYNAAGIVIATGTANPDGSYSVALVPAQTNGETVRVTQTETDGDVSPPATAVAPDLTPPAIPTAALDATGGVVTGTGEPGATITVRGVGGATLGTAIVTAAGSYAATLTTAQTNGETLAVTQADAAGNVSPPLPLVAPDYTAPTAPVVAIAADGASLTGTGEPGATVTVRDAANTVVGIATVAGDGTFATALTPAQANGGTLAVVQADAAGNASPATSVAAPDITAPPAPVLTVAADGTGVTGTGEPGATVTITGTGGVVLGIATVAADGSYSAALGTVQNNGQSLTATQADAAGNVSPPATAIAPDLVAPIAPTATVSPDGTLVTGTGEGGARIVITDPAGAAIGVATVAADGTYSVTLGTPQVDGERLTATQTDGGGNASPPVVAIAPDLTAPAIPTLIIATDGTTASGIGEPGATITLTGPGGTVIGTTPVAADGSYSIALVPPRINGEAFTASQADAAGNASPAAAAVAPDLTAPAAPVANVDGTGTTVVGTGEAGATVRVSGPGGALGSAVVAADGSYTITLSTPQANGQALVVTQTDPAGNASPGTALTAPDITAPAAPTAIVAGDGASVSGSGEAGATVTITAPGGAIIGTALVATNGNYTAVLTSPQTNGELLGASQRDPAGNASPVAPALAPDSTAPAAPVAAISGDGGFVTGTGEAGATVTVTASGGAVLGTATVTASGTYTVTLNPPQTDGQTLGVTQADAAGNVSPPASVLAPDSTSPLSPTATVTLDGTAVVGTGVPGGQITVTSQTGTAIGSAIVAADGSYIVTLDVPQRNGELLGVVQADGVGNVSPAVSALAPDLTAPAAPTATVGSEGNVVTGVGEPGATVTITGPGNAILGTAVVGGSGNYLVTLTTPQRNGEALVATQRDAAGNLSGPGNAVAPDLTAPPPPTGLTVTGDGSSLTGSGEAGARVEVRGNGGVLLGTATVSSDGSFSVPLAPIQVTGATVSVTQADAAGNVSGAATVVAPFDIQAFGNTDTASIDLVPVTSNVNAGSANYLALVALGVVNLQAQVLGIPNVQFTVAAGHTLDATFTYDGLATLGVTNGYTVVVQRFDGTNWVAVNGAPGSSLLEVGVLNGNLVATETLDPGSYRAFVTFQGGLAGIGVLGQLNVTGRDTDFTDIQSVVPAAGSGNVITDPGPGGEVDVVSAATRVDSVTHNGVVTTLTGNGTVVDGDWGTLVINTDGSYTYTPDANAAAIGKTDVFTYTLIDPSDNERESASLSITVGSGDITGVPLAVNDVASADVTYRNVEVVTPPAAQFNYGTGLFGGTGASTFVVQPNTNADITIVARANGLALLPTYNLIVQDANNTVIRNATSLSAVALGDTNATATFVLNDLPPGNYRYSVSSGTAAVGFTSSVSLGASTTLLNSYEVATRETVQGNLFANDTTHTPFAAVHVDRGTGFAEVGDTPVVLTGRYGSLTVNEAGGYSYQPSATLAYSTVDLVDSFTYHLVQPNGATSVATLSVTIDVPPETLAANTQAALVQFTAHESDVIALDGATAHAAAAAPETEAAAIGRAAYDLFEGKGDLEDVLTHYLATQDIDQAAAAAPVAEHPATVLTDAMPTIADPLDYLVLSPDDNDRHGITTNHVV